MKRLGDELHAEGPADRVYDLDYLRKLPPTPTLVAHRADVGAQIETARADGDTVLVHRLERDLAQTDAILAAATVRDGLQAARPAGCWCFGTGGRGERFVVVPEAEGVRVVDHDGSERRAFGPGDVVSFLSTYCGCPEGEARRERDQMLRERVGSGYARQCIESRVAAIWTDCGVPELFAACTLDSYPATARTAPVLAAIRAWLASDRWALVLAGPYGVGKSGLAIGGLRDAAERELPGLFVKVPDLLLTWRATFRRDATTSEEALIDALRTVPYLVLDDLGAEKESDWATTALFQVLDARHDSRRKTIVTTNLPLGELALHLGKRTMERFREGGVVLEVAGPNLRHEQAA